MKTKITLLGALLLSSLFISAQTVMNIHQSNGAMLQLPINTIDSVTYAISNPGNLATVTTLSIENITTSGATSGGNIANGGGSAITQRGIVWGTNLNPTTADNSSVNGNGIGSFTSNLSGLTQNTTYYVRAYAINSAGTSYGNQLSFTTATTNTFQLATLTTTSVSSITGTSAVSGGNISSEGGSTVTSRGVCWGTSNNPTIADNSSINGSGIGSFTSNLNGLNVNTTYYVRAYAINSSGTSYGSEFSFTTTVDESKLPTVTTLQIDEFGWKNISALLKGVVEEEGGSTVSARGFCWDVLTTVDINSNKSINGAGIGSFNNLIEDLEGGKSYYVRAYATNSYGTSYGNAIHFSTEPISPYITTIGATSIISNSAVLGGNEIKDNGAEITQKGVCWGTSPNPTLARWSSAINYTNEGSGIESFSSTINNLQSLTTYYVRAYAINSEGTSYGEEVTFMAIGLPALYFQTQYYSEDDYENEEYLFNLTSNSAEISAFIKNDGGASVTSRGFYWGTSPDPTSSDNSVAKGSGTGWFSTKLTELTPGTTYYVKAYATNSGGTTNRDISFTTLELATLTTQSVSDITNISALSGGNITNNGGATVTSRGICWSTSSNPTTSDNLTVEGYSIYNFTSNLSGLKGNTTYYVRAYAINSVGTAYGNEVIFTTISLPTLTTTSISSITGNSAVAGGNITNDGGATVTSRGVCWSRSSNPTTSDSDTSSSLTVNGSGTGSFIGNLKGLSRNTTYYVRAYAINSAGTSYGNKVSFKTTALATLTTDSASEITLESAISGGNVTNDGGGAITSRGVCWSTSSHPTTSDSLTVNGSGTGNFTSNLSNLKLNTRYYVRGYAINSVGTSYGNEVSFATISKAQNGNGVTDASGNTYQSVIIGTQEWMSENLRTTKYSDGASIPNITNKSQWGSWLLVTGAWSHYANDSQYEATYGKLYNWYAASDSRNVCPTGWHVPTDAEWTVLTDYLSANGHSGAEGTALKSTSGWDNDRNGTDDYGWLGLPGGNRDVNGDFYYIGNNGYWWSSEVIGADLLVTALHRNLGNLYGRVSRSSNNKRYGFSVRCLKNGDNYYVLPTLTTASVSNITSTSALVVGNITNDGNADVTERGVCWGTNTNPTTADNSSLSGSGTGSFTSDLSGLTVETTYYVRAYAINSVGTAYGNEVSFTTSPAQLASLTTTTVSSITGTTAVSGGNITDNGGATVTESGVCWGTSAKPTTADNSSENGTGTGSFTSDLSGLTAETTYYVRAYAINSVGTAYGNEVSFTTSPAQLASLTTTTVSSITGTTAVSGGNITDNGGATVTESGVCWGTSANPTTADNSSENGTGTGGFTSNLSGLTVGTTYYVRAYAINNIGTSYGNEVSFTATSKVKNGNGVTDANGNTYQSVIIGTQEWMSENLRTSKYSDGTMIPNVTSRSDWPSLSTEAWCNYDNSSTNDAMYGKLYNWYAVNTSKLCPTGWHVPTDAEWAVLTDYLTANGHNGTEGTALKSTSGWNSGGNGTDDYGWLGLPGGNRSSYNGSFSNVGYNGYWWSSSQFDTNYAWYRYLLGGNDGVSRNYYYKRNGFSVRCLRD